MSKSPKSRSKIVWVTRDSYNDISIHIEKPECICNNYHLESWESIDMLNLGNCCPTNKRLFPEVCKEADPKKAIQRYRITTELL